MGRINQPQLSEFIYIWNVLDFIKRHLFDFFPAAINSHQVWRLIPLFEVFCYQNTIILKLIY